MLRLELPDGAEAVAYAADSAILVIAEKVDELEKNLGVFNRELKRAWVTRHLSCIANKNYFTIPVEVSTHSHSLEHPSFLKYPGRRYSTLTLTAFAFNAAEIERNIRRFQSLRELFSISKPVSYNISQPFRYDLTQAVGLEKGRNIFPTLSTNSTIQRQ